MYQNIGRFQCVCPRCVFRCRDCLLPSLPITYLTPVAGVSNAGRRTGPATGVKKYNQMIQYDFQKNRMIQYDFRVLKFVYVFVHAVGGAAPLHSPRKTLRRRQPNTGSDG